MKLKFSRQLPSSIGRVYVWSPRPPRAPRYNQRDWSLSVEYTLSAIRTFCDELI